MNIHSADETGIQQALEVLQDGGIVAHATETCYGLACDLNNPHAVRKLFEIKRRPADLPVSALFSGIDHARAFVEWPLKAKELADAHLPGPLTLILPTASLAADILYLIPSEEMEWCGVRISSHPIAQQLVSDYGKPLSTTSANLHREPNPYSVEEIEAQYQNNILEPDLVLDSGKIDTVESSTVVRIDDETIEVLREGGTAL